MPSSDRLALYAAILIAGLAAAIPIHVGGFVPGGTDSSGYVSAADRWRSGELFGPAPLHWWAAWPNAADSASPVAYRPALIRGADVSVYPLGFPVFSAAAVAIAGRMGAYITAPFFGALLAVCSFAIARMLAGNFAGLLAALLISVTPATLFHTIHPMSDVPAAACWALGWLMALGGTASSAAASGAAVSAAILIRPNLAPLALVPGLVLTVGADGPSLPTRKGWHRPVVYALVAAVGPIVVAWSQAVLYGGPFEGGYPGWRGFFQQAQILPNLKLYPRLLMDLHSPLLFAGLAGAFVVSKSRGDPVGNRRRLAIASSALLIATLNIALYLPYLSYDEWPFVRFFLPALTALFILYAATLAKVGRWLAARSRWLAPLVLIGIVPIVSPSVPQLRYAVNDWRSQARIIFMGHYLEAALPANAAVLSFMHSGELRHYTARQVVRLDVLDPATLDRVVDDLRRHGYRPVFVLDELHESGPFRARFPQSKYGRLDWAPRAAFTTTSSIWYFDAGDRDRFARGERWPTDWLR